jgi:hypothetical protein
LLSGIRPNPMLHFQSCPARINSNLTDSGQDLTATPAQT